jgi:hypothetical protein
VQLTTLFPWPGASALRIAKHQSTIQWKERRNKKKKNNPLDKHLAPICALIESQPQVIQLTLSNFAIAMLLTTQSLQIQVQLGLKTANE